MNRGKKLAELREAEHAAKRDVFSALYDLSHVWFGDPHLSPVALESLRCVVRCYCDVREAIDQYDACLTRPRAPAPTSSSDSKGGGK